MMTCWHICWIVKFDYRCWLDFGVDVGLDIVVCWHNCLSDVGVDVALDVGIVYFDVGIDVDM